MEIVISPSSCVLSLPSNVVPQCYHHTTIATISRSYRWRPRKGSHNPNAIALGLHSPCSSTQIPIVICFPEDSRRVPKVILHQSNLSTARLPPAAGRQTCAQIAHLPIIFFHHRKPFAHLWVDPNCHKKDPRGPTPSTCWRRFV